MKISAAIILLYGLLLLLGGMIGFLKAQSIASLVMGSVFALIAFGSGLALFKGSIVGWWAGLIVSIFLTAFFGYRFYMSNKFMPSGLMAIISVIVFIALLFLAKEKIITART